ncbi:unnamed protein product [Pipistrellus nathusii]|uniref:Guanylate-binding protein N-terminal domain-containing protein n=1 Tax=Pipistrellus nathusii TaxID=59473 RepID=A0ABN9ZYH1_PIPNA
MYFQGDPRNDSWIFALAVLLCSSFVYNSMNTINHQAQEQLQYPSRNPTSMCYGVFGNGGFSLLVFGGAEGPRTKENV